MCTPNNALDRVLDVTPKERHEDLVFLQNGMLLPWLQEQGLEECTQACCYFSALKGQPAQDGGQTVVHGRCASLHSMIEVTVFLLQQLHARLIAAWIADKQLLGADPRWGDDFRDVLARGQIACQVLDRDSYRLKMIEKLLWATIFWMLSSAEGGLTVWNLGFTCNRGTCSTQMYVNMMNDSVTCYAGWGDCKPPSGGSRAAS